MADTFWVDEWNILNFLSLEVTLLYPGKVVWSYGSLKTDIKTKEETRCYHLLS